MVGETIVDIYDQWRYITNKVDDAYKYFIGKAKNKKRIGGQNNRGNSNSSNPSNKK
jgi:hypothetical protein